MSSPNWSVQLRKVNLSLNNRYLLQNVTMSVKANSIYCLLGPSGSGKTTLMSICLGILKPDQGQIYRNSDRLGFMPQAMALHLYFTPNEAITFYGRLYDMEQSDLESRRKSIINLLNMSHRQNTLICRLSGGERRRVSLACSIVHRPDIIVLDEPTVGVDPLLRTVIWRHLRTLSECSTVLITTQCLIEADAADRVAFIREGRILVEDEPPNLRRIHRVSHLDENVFLALCREDERRKEEEKEKEEEDEQEEEEEREKEEEVKRVSKFGLSWHKLRPLLSKNWTVLKRHYSFMLLQVMLPVIVLIFFTMAVGRDLKAVSVAMVDEDGKECHLNHSIDCQNLINPSIKNVNQISCLLVKALNESSGLSLIKMEERTVARTSVKMGLTKASIVLPAGFAFNAVTNLLISLGLNNEPKHDVMMDRRMSLATDNTDLQVLRTVHLAVIEAMASTMSRILEMCSRQTELFDMDSEMLQKLLLSKGFKTHSLFEPNLTTSTLFDSLDLTKFMLPGLAVLVLNLMAMALTADHLSNERDEGLFTRELVANVKPSAQIMATLLVHGLVVLIQILTALTLLLISANPAMGRENFLEFFIRLSLLFLVLFLASLSGMCLGLVVTASTKSRLQTFQLGSSLILPFLLLAGIVWPRSTMPYWLVFISDFLPVTKSAELATQIVLRPVFSNFTWMGLVWPIVWTAACLWVSLKLVAKWKLRSLS